MNKQNLWHRVGRYVVWLLLIPLLIFGGQRLFDEQQAIWISLCVALLACLPFFFAFEKKQTDVRRLTVLAVMVALSVAGRYAFSFLPHFKPVTAIVVLCGMYLGCESGFLCGAMSALLSNFLFGQGAWTPFQMFAWGVIGLFAGVLAKPLRRTPLLLLYGAFGGIAFSLFMDTFTTLWMNHGSFSLARYGALIVTALPITAVYAGSNVLFLLLLAKPMGEILERIKTKYGI